MKCFRLYISVSLFILIASGCIAVGPRYKRPPVSLAENWLDAEKQGVLKETKEYRYWWRVFKDPCLDKLIEAAYRKNLTLRIAGVRVLQARAQLGIAVGEWFPQTQQAFGNVEKVRLSAHAPAAAGQTALNFYQSQAGLTAAWELDFWGKFSRAIEAADENLLATIADYDDTLVSLTADAASFYIIIRTLEKSLGIARQNVVTQTESLTIAQERFSGGTTSERDVAQAKTLLEDTRALIPALEILLRQTQNALSVLLGMPPSDLVL